MKTAEKIKILKKTLKKTNRDFAKDLGFAVTSIANISSGKYRMTDTIARKFHEVYNVNPSWLLFDNGSMFNDVEEKEIIERLKKLDKRDKTIIYDLLKLMSKENATPQTMDAIEEHFSKIPILGCIAAGNPILTTPTQVSESSETVISNIPQDKKDSFYALRVKGNSMIEHRIHDGDIVIINKDAPPIDRCIAVCLIDGNTSTLKQILIHSENDIELKPFNKDMQSIWLTSKNDLIIQGVLHQTIIQN